MSTKAECKSKDTETPPAAIAAAGGVSLWVENKKEVKRRMVGRDQYCALFLSIRLNTAGDISLFEKGEQPLLFIRCAVDGAHMISGGFDGGAERVFAKELDASLAGGRYQNHKDLMSFPDCGHKELNLLVSMVVQTTDLLNTG